MTAEVPYENSPNTRPQDHFWIRGAPPSPPTISRVYYVVLYLLYCIALSGKRLQVGGSLLQIWTMRGGEPPSVRRMEGQREASPAPFRGQST